MTYKDITSFEIACQVLGISAELPDLSVLTPKKAKYIIDHHKLTTIIEGINKIENWKADYTNLNQYKYCAWPTIEADQDRPSGFGFSYSDYGYAHTGTAAGSRLSVGKSEIVYWLLDAHKELYISNLLIVE